MYHFNRHSAIGNNALQTHVKKIAMLHCSSLVFETARFRMQNTFYCLRMMLETLERGEGGGGGGGGGGGRKRRVGEMRGRT